MYLILLNSILNKACLIDMFSLALMSTFIRQEIIVLIPIQCKHLIMMTVTITKACSRLKKVDLTFEFEIIRAAFVLSSPAWEFCCRPFDPNIGNFVSFKTVSSFFLFADNLLNLFIFQEKIMWHLLYTVYSTINLQQYLIRIHLSKH